MLHALVIHVQAQWAGELISQLKAALTRQIPLELDPQNTGTTHVKLRLKIKRIGRISSIIAYSSLDPNLTSPVLFKRVISLEFVKEPPPNHLSMMSYYLVRNHPNADQNEQRVIPKDAAFIRNLLPPVGHAEQ